MIRETEMISLTDGSTKTLEEYVGSSSPSPVPVSLSWRKLGEYKECLNSTTNLNEYSAAMQSIFDSTDLNEIMLVVNPYGSSVYSFAIVPIDLFRTMDIWFEVASGNSAVDTWASNMYISNDETDGTYSFKTYSNNTAAFAKFDVTFYGR